MKTGLFGGTFNPIHNGHMAIAQAAVSSVGLDRLIFIPTGSAPHKEESKVSRIDRLNMLRLAIEQESKMEISTYELEKSEVSYSADTAKHFKMLYPEDDLFFLIGDDSYRDFSTWHEPDRLLSICTLLVFPRLGIQVSPPAIKIPMKKVEVSSSNIRDKIRREKDFSYLLPKPVFDYIIEKKLYKD